MKRSLIGTVLLALSSCTGPQQPERVARPDDLASAVGGEPCPAEAVGFGARIDITGKGASMSFRLPVGMRRSYVSNDRMFLGENWASDDGLNVSYRVYEDPIDHRPLDETDKNIIVCEEVIGGRRTAIRMFFATATVTPGQYVTAIWTLGDGSVLSFQATSRDSTRRDELLQIVRSVEFDK
jgi:hypothetical protein